MSDPIPLDRVRAIRDAIAGIADRRGLSPDTERDLRRQAVADFLSGRSAAFAVATAERQTRPAQADIGPRGAA